MNLLQKLDELCARHGSTKRKTVMPTELRMALFEALSLGAESVRAAPPIELEGCGDGSCIVARPKGMHTNGGCRCDERRLRMAVHAWRREADRLSALLLKERESKEERP